MSCRSLSAAQAKDTTDLGRRVRHRSRCILEKLLFEDFAESQLVDKPASIRLRQPIVRRHSLELQQPVRRSRPWRYCMSTARSITSSTSTYGCLKARAQENAIAWRPRAAVLYLRPNVVHWMNMRGAKLTSRLFLQLPMFAVGQHIAANDSHARWECGSDCLSREEARHSLRH